MKEVIRLSLIALSISIFTGCNSFSKDKRIEPTYNLSLLNDETAAAIVNKYFDGSCGHKQNGSFNQAFIDKFNGAQTEDEKKAIRDEMINEVLLLSDHVFAKYYQAIIFRDKAFVLGADITAMALSGVGALTTGGSTPNILSGISTFILGSKEKASEILYANQAVSAIAKIMIANRDSRKADFITKIKDDKSTTEFSIHHALRELQEVHIAGNIAGALTVIENIAANKTSEAKKKLTQENAK